MILTDRQIKEALRNGHLVVDPAPDDGQFGPTSLDLRVSDDFRRFKPELYTTQGLDVRLNLDRIRLSELAPHMEHLQPESDGTVPLHPGVLVIAATLERIELPPEGRLAARVEGRSSFARLGLVVHMTAPTIHNTFRGVVTLEMMNFGPIPLVLSPNKTRICQLILEQLSEPPVSTLDSPFQDQTSPLGSSRKPT